MYPPEKHPQNEKLKSLIAQAEQVLDVLMENPDLNTVSIQIMLMMIEIIEAMLEPEKPG